MANNIKNTIVSVEYGDWVTLYSFTTDDILEIIVGDNFAPDIESQIIDKCIKDCIQTGDGKYQIQHIKKRSTPITSNELSMTILEGASEHCNIQMPVQKEPIPTNDELHTDVSFTKTFKPEVQNIIADHSATSENLSTHTGKFTSVELLHNYNERYIFSSKQLAEATQKEKPLFLALYVSTSNCSSIPISESDLMPWDISSAKKTHYFALRKKCGVLAEKYSRGEFPRSHYRTQLEAELSTFLQTIISPRNPISLDVSALLTRAETPIKPTVFEAYIENTVVNAISNSYSPAAPPLSSKVIKHTISQALSKRIQLQKNCISCPEVPTRIPPSTIIVALLSVKGIGHIGYITIVADEHDQCADDGIYWVGRRISASILAAIKMHTSRHFRYNDVKYWVAQYNEYNNAEKYLSIIARFCNPEEPQTVYVFEQKSVNQFKNREYETVTAMIPCANTSFLIPSTVYYEKATHRYFMNESLYILLREKYGLPYLKLKSQYSENSKKGYLFLKQHSELNLLGYSVSIKNGLSLEERRALLSSIIDSGVLSKVEIMNHLEWLINSRTNNVNHENAISEWKSDLLFLSNYRLETQRKIWIDTFKSKHSINKLGRS